MTEITRRGLLQGAAALLVPPALAQQLKSPWKIGGFTKTLQDLSYERTAEVAADLGWDGIECAVRAKGQVLPERVEEELPRLAGALGAKGLELLVMATDIRAVDEPFTAKLLRTAAKLGIRLYRLGPFRYQEGMEIPRQLANIGARLKDLAALNRELGVTGLVQNHSGNGYVGAGIWDLYELVKDRDPRELGVHFDFGHATVESGLSWPTAFSLVADRVGAVIVKDFFWKHAPGEGAKLEWCPIGQGAVNPRFVKMLEAARFRGPITMQFEYPFPGGEGLESRLRAMKADGQKLREWLSG